MEVKDLPEAAIKALEEAGVDIATVICTDKTGKIHMMKNKEVRSSDAKFPIATTEIEAVTSISMVRYKGSTCEFITINGVSVLVCW